MRTYDVIVTPDARNDLAAVRDYIAGELGSPESARSVLHSLRDTVASLGAMPTRVRPIDEEPWHTRGVHRILSGNFFVYYRIDEECGVVYVLNVMYARGSQRRASASYRD